MAMTTALRTQYSVAMPSGTYQPVLTEFEQAYLTDRVARYTEQFGFTNVGDLQDVDRVLVMELFCHRWGIWLGQGHKYDGDRIDEAALVRDLEKYNLRLSVMKKTLGIDKPTRDRQRGEGSVYQYLSELPRRAKAFGIMRNRQAGKAVELAMELIGHVTAYRNAPDDEERRKLRITAEDIMDYVWNVFRPEMESIDKDFREKGPDAQRMWIRDQ